MKQKAAAEQAVSEKTEREAKATEKEIKMQLADERHQQNMEALANLQKILVRVNSKKCHFLCSE